MGLGVTATVIADAGGIGDRGSLREATVEVNEISMKEELNVSELLGICSVDPVSIIFEFVCGTG